MANGNKLAPILVVWKHVRSPCEICTYVMHTASEQSSNYRLLLSVPRVPNSKTCKTNTFIYRWILVWNVLHNKGRTLRNFNFRKLHAPVAFSSLFSDKWFLDNGNPATFFYWAYSVSMPATHPCIVIFSDGPGRWHDRQCLSSCYYACEYRKY